MKENSTDTKVGTQGEAGFSPWQRLKTKKISYLTLPLIVMATITEFVILSTGWRYQKMVCLPQGMAVTFFGIGPIGATILAVELLKLPLAIWTASRHGWQKFMMVTIGLPLICLLTFQLVKDMAVYEMGVALTPANQFLEKAMAEDLKSGQLNGELAGIQAMKTERENKLAELSAQQAKAKADLEDALKRNEEARKDAIDPTEYQRSQLSEVDAREAAITQQFNADTDQINKSLADLRVRRETELGRDAKWNAEEARIDNDYKAKLADYQNRKAQYDKDKAAYDSANVVKRQFMKEPVDPGVPPVRETNTILKSALLAQIETEIKAKEDELSAVDAKRRDRVAQVEEDARQLRQQFQGRSGTKRDEVDKDRATLLAAEAKLDTDWEAQRKQVDAEVATAVQKVDGVQSELDASRKRAEGFYEQREAALRVTQVSRIATTVEIVRQLLKGEHPATIKATAKERGDTLTDQISMVRVWVYPVLAFIVAFLPTLMVEVGFSTVFQPEQTRPPYRMGFLGRRLHWLYTRAGRIKMRRYERMAKEAGSQIAAREQLKAAAEKALQEKDAQLRAAAAERDGKLRQMEEQYAAEARQKEEEWGGKLASMTDSLNRAVVEKDSLRNLQKVEVERQVQLRQNAWSDQLRQLRQEQEDQRAASEADRAAILEEHRKKFIEFAEDCKSQVTQVRRQAADAELAAKGATARVQQELKEAIHARDAMEAQLKHAREDAAREMENALREEKHRIEREQSEREKALLHQEEKLEHRLKQREQELSIPFEARLAEERARVEQEARRREADLEHQVETRVLEIEARKKQELLQKEEEFQFKLKQREQQLQGQAESRLLEMQSQAEQESRRRQVEFERQIEAQSRENVARLKQELQQKELLFEARLKHREQELSARSAARETELQNKWTADIRLREEEWERQTAVRLQALESRLVQEAQAKEEMLVAKSRQREKQLQAKLDNARAESLAEQEETLRRQGVQVEAVLGELESELRKGMRTADRDGVIASSLDGRS